MPVSPQGSRATPSVKVKIGGQECPPHTLLAGRLILSDGLLLFKELKALRERQIRRHGMEVAIGLRRLDVDILEQKYLARESQVHASDRPVVVGDLSLINLEMAAMIKMAEDAPSEPHIFKK